MTTPTPIREWAIANGIPGVGRRGPIGYDVQVRYAAAHNLPTPERVDRAPAAESRKRSPWSCTCGRQWVGLVECHCAGCHRHFRSITGFDLHLVTGDDGETSVCVDPMDVRYRSGPRKGYPKFRLVDAHYGPIYATGDERPEGI